MIEPGVGPTIRSPRAGPRPRQGGRNSLAHESLVPAGSSSRDSAVVPYADSRVVVFDREVARHMVCHSLVNFALRDGELRSDPIDPGEFASFCELKPGKIFF